MAIGTAEKRRSAAAVPFGVGVTPNALKDAEWRAQVAGTYPFSGESPVAPTITTTANRNHQENQTAIVTMTATGDTPIAWSITGGADAALFGIIEATGALSFDVAPDYEDPQDADTNNVYVVEVTATNDAGSDDLTLNITVTDRNEDAGAQPGPAYSPQFSSSYSPAFSPAAMPLIMAGA